MKTAPFTPASPIARTAGSLFQRLRENSGHARLLREARRLGAMSDQDLTRSGLTREGILDTVLRNRYAL